jgi:hypothetical protein
MERLADIDQEEKRVLAEIIRCVQQIRNLVQSDIKTLWQGIDLLAALRSAVYEDLNQLQHEALILAAARWLKEQRFPGDEIQWSWHPRQTGGADEPDLTGKIDGDVVLSAEATTSQSPKGIIDRRMAKTLDKLSAMTGEKWYFVHTEVMERRANTMVDKRGYQICVQRLPAENPNTN